MASYCWQKGDVCACQKFDAGAGSKHVSVQSHVTRLLRADSRCLKFDQCNKVMHPLVGDINELQRSVCREARLVMFLCKIPVMNLHGHYWPGSLLML